MLVEKRLLWENNDKINYVAYLMDNSPDIENERKHPAIIICGGGGFVRITDKEKEPVALFFLNHGFQAFVLNYTTKKIGDSTYPNPEYDLAKMIVTVREHAVEWNIDISKIAIAGFSAGGSICASLATQWNEKFLYKKLEVSSEMLKPNAAILAYPLLDFEYQKKKIVEDENCNSFLEFAKMKKGDFLSMAMDAAIGVQATEKQLKEGSPINHITPNMPPVFIWGTANDGMVYVGQILKFAEKLSGNNIPYELHVFESGYHGLSLANHNTTNSHEKINTDVSVWTTLAVNFLNRHFLL
ncbi:alpha/beta hydrolase [Pectinatus sottacetonis]|uniref:alpha/beta hydrolase n=1 Tax=Pectinatus sottacetonis TaxID=1002795 RepID=UPI0018C6B2E9|nr:alpha/beta hydrolase [Pectinatus sottacetonis]